VGATFFERESQLWLEKADCSFRYATASYVLAEKTACISCSSFGGEGRMNKLAELRKSLLDRSGSGRNQSDSRSVHVSPPTDVGGHQSVQRYSVDADGRNVDKRSSLSQTEIDSTAANMFATKAYQDGRVNLTEWTSSIEQVAQTVVCGLERMKVLCEQLETFSFALPPLQAFEQQLATMAKSFKPVEQLHAEVENLINSLHGPVAQMAESLESVGTFKQRITELAKSVDSLYELKARFCELARAFAGNPEDTPVH
jgi:hypothetical protein